jgi:hypothetical protein
MALDPTDCPPPLALALTRSGHAAPVELVTDAPPPRLVIDQPPPVRETPSSPIRAVRPRMRT